MQKKTIPSLVYFWEDIILYIGHDIGRGIRYHQNIPGCLFCIGLNGAITIAHKHENSSSIYTHSALMLPNSSWSDSFTDDLTFALIFGATNPLKNIIKNKMQQSCGNLLYDFQDNQTVITEFKQIFNQRTDRDSVKRTIDRLFPSSTSNLGKKNSLDERILRVTELINNNLDNKKSIAELAEKVNLSPPRLMQLFKHETGLSAGRYLLWRRFMNTLKLAVQNHNITDAAILSGFADVAQFSRTFKSIVGISPNFMINPSHGLDAKVGEKQ